MTPEQITNKLKVLGNTIGMLGLQLNELRQRVKMLVFDRDILLKERDTLAAHLQHLGYTVEYDKKGVRITTD